MGKKYLNSVQIQGKRIKILGINFLNENSLKVHKNE